MQALSHYRTAQLTITQRNTIRKRCITASSYLRLGNGSSELDHTVRQVRHHDPSGFLPGLLLPTPTMRQVYFAVRSFWVETGLRFDTTARVPLSASPSEHLDWWQQGIDEVFCESERLSADTDHPTLRLIRKLKRENELPWDKHRFQELIQGRRDDMLVLQYDSVEHLQRHAQRSCANLLSLVLEGGQLTTSKNAKAHQAAQLIGITHGLTIALRTSIPVMSLTGKVVIPSDLCQKYGVKSPRYLLSALGQGDKECITALQNAVRDIATIARDNLQKARDLRSGIIEEQNGERSVAVLLPGLVSESFLNRLERVNFQLTNRDLRNVAFFEHLVCSGRVLSAYLRQAY